MSNPEADLVTLSRNIDGVPAGTIGRIVSTTQTGFLCEVVDRAPRQRRAIIVPHDAVDTGTKTTSLERELEHAA